MSSLLQYLPEDYILQVMNRPVDSPYVYGGKNGPFLMPYSIIAGYENVRGYDCSGYTQHVLRALGAIGHGVPWMTASQTASVAETLTFGSQQVGDLAFFGSGSSISHVTLVSALPGSDGWSPIIGANSGGSSTFGDDPDARVKHADSDYWRSGFSHYGSFRGGYGLEERDWLISFALYMCSLQGITDSARVDMSKQGWQMFRQYMSEALDGNAGYTGEDIYASLLLLNDGVSTWDQVVGAVTGAYSSVLDLVFGDDNDSAESESADSAEEGDDSWVDYAADSASAAWDWLTGD